MTFDKVLSYLGISEMTFKDGSRLYKLSFFDQGGGQPVQVNVAGNREDLLRFFSSAKFGQSLLCHFALAQKDNLFRLSLVACDPAGK